MNEFLELIKKLKSVDDAIEILSTQIEIDDDIKKDILGSIAKAVSRILCILYW